MPYIAVKNPEYVEFRFYWNIIHIICNDIMIEWVELWITFVTFSKDYFYRKITNPYFFLCLYKFAYTRNQSL